MKKMSLGQGGFDRKTKRTRKREFFDEMTLVVPRAELVSLIAHHAPALGAKGGRPPFAVETMLRIHFLQQRFNLSDPAMEEPLYDTPMFRELDGSSNVAVEGAGISAPESGEGAAERGEITLQTADCSPKPPHYEITHSNSRKAGCGADLPLSTTTQSMAR